MEISLFKRKKRIGAFISGKIMSATSAYSWMKIQKATRHQNKKELELYIKQRLIKQN